MLKRLHYLLLLLIISQYSIAAYDIDSNSIAKPYLLSNHPFGLFISRINHNFSLNAATKSSLSFTMSRGNVWLPYAKGKLANNQSDRDFLSQYEWHERNYYAEYNNITDYKTKELDADGLFSSYYFQLKQPLSKSADVSINCRFGSLTGGEMPYSLLTNDEVIEQFHSNLLGGEDPFGRKSRAYGLAGFYYKDVNGKVLQVKKNDFFFNELSADWNYYGKSFIPGVRSIYSAHTGFSKMKQSYLLNTGLAITQLKRFYFKRNFLDVGVAGSVVFPGTFMKMPVEINNNKYLASLEVNCLYLISLKRNQIGVGINYHLQSPFDKSSESDYFIIESEGISSHGHYAISHLNRPLQGWTLTLSYQLKKWAITTFFREDALVDNAPDIQVGWAINIKL